MPLNPGTIGLSTPAVPSKVDARWIMAYAAGLRDFNPRYMDTAAGTVMAHPVFPVCLEWPVCLAAGDIEGSESLTAQERNRGVHATHDIHILQPIVAGARYSTTATIVGMERPKPGGTHILRLDTVNAATGELTIRTYQTGIYRGVDVAGEPRLAERIPPPPAFDGTPDRQVFDIPVPEGMAHTYTECSRIWNPVHTDRAVALSAGLPDIILHGTATLALAVSVLVDRFCHREPSRVSRVGCRFSAMVLMPSVLKVEAARHDTDIAFRVLTDAGQPAISQGFLCTRE